MQVKKINDWFEKFGRFEVRHRWAFIIGLAVITVFCCLGLPRLKLDNGEEDWFDNWDAVKLNQDHFESIFGSTDTLMAHITAKDVFDPEVLQMIDDLGDDLLHNVPYADSIMAFSLCDYRADADFRPLEPYIRDIVQRVLHDGLPTGVCLNVNFPKTPAFKGVKLCRMSMGTWESEVSKCHHPRGYDYWWMMGHYVNDEPEATDTDRWALDNAYVAITPTRIDVTAHEAFEKLKEFEKL